MLVVVVVVVSVVVIVVLIVIVFFGRILCSRGCGCGGCWSLLIVLVVAIVVVVVVRAQLGAQLMDTSFRLGSVSLLELYYLLSM